MPGLLTLPLLPQNWSRGAVLRRTAGSKDLNLAGLTFVVNSESEKPDELI